MLKPPRLLRISAISAAMVLFAAACGGGDDAAPAPDAQTEIILVAQNITFDQDILTVPVGEEVTVTYEHLVSGVSHNLHVIVSSERNFSTVITSGPVTQTLTFTINEAGTYTFQCDVHPDVMNGTLTVQKSVQETQVR